MENVVQQVEGVPHVFKSTPFLAIAIGLAFLFGVLIVEAFKPGLLTGPIRHLLQSIGLKNA